MMKLRRKNYIARTFLATFLACASTYAVAATQTNSVSENKFLDMPLEELFKVSLYVPNILSTHIHKEGEWMFGLSEHLMYMSGNLSGTSTTNNAQIFNSGFRMAPQNMFMSMTMFHVMYAPTDDFTFMIMVPYIYNKMTILTAPTLMPAMRNKEFTTQSNGFGDLALSANHLLFHVMGTRTKSLSAVL